MTAAKDVKVRANCKKDICLVTGLVADNGAPASATAGVAMYETATLGKESSRNENGANFPHHPASKHRLCVNGGSSAQATGVLWGYLESAAAWFPIVLNGGNDMFATYDTYTELLDGLSHFDRVYLQVDWTAGTVEAWLTVVEEAF